jgi:hypothetical protein
VSRALEVSEFVADGTINPTKLGRLTVRAFHTNKQVSVTIVGAELVGR